MKADFTRDTFDATNHYLRVLMQQGRVQLDADWNEQASILLHYLQRLAEDLIGPHCVSGNGFKIAPRAGVPRDFLILLGHYYVDGRLCENVLKQGQVRPYTEQPDYPLSPEAELKNGTKYLVYLDVWERLVTWIEDLSIRE